MNLVAAAAAAIKKEFGEKAVIYEEASEQVISLHNYKKLLKKYMKLFILGYLYFFNDGMPQGSFCSIV